MTAMPSAAPFPLSRERDCSIPGNLGMENDRDSRASGKWEPGNANPIVNLPSKFKVSDSIHCEDVKGGGVV